MSASFIPDPYVNYHDAHITAPFPDFAVDKPTGLIDGLARRWRRERRRRKVGRAYDMAIEIARVLPRHSRVLDVGCGSGYIAHHLSALLGTRVLGIDLAESTEAPISYRQFNGTCFPVEDESVDAVVLCYVFHHAQDMPALMLELHRVLKRSGVVVVYEDIPEIWWDRLVCAIHDLKWRARTGPCRFNVAQKWRDIFHRAGFQTVSDRKLSRWRNLAHPVSRNFYLLLRSDQQHANAQRITLARDA